MIGQINKLVVLFIQYSFYPLMIAGSLLTNIILFNIFEMKWYSFLPAITYFSAIIIIVIAEKYLPHKKEWQKNKGDAGTDFIQTFIVLLIVSKISENLLPILLFFPILWVRDKISISL